MLGAIVGDVFGAAYEFRSGKREDFDLFSEPRFFTDDTVLTVATAVALMSDGDYAEAYRRWALFDVTCQGSVPEALIAFFDAGDFEHSIRLAISLGGDADTQAAIAGSVAEAFWGGVPVHLEEEVRAVLDEPLLEVLDRFHRQFRE
jgi:ADP-ribosylglycohydrolase